jgi:hypothetical protein
MRRIFYSPEFPASAATLAAAAAAGATEIVQSATQAGYVEIPDPPASRPDPQSVAPSDLMAAMAAAGVVTQAQAQAVVAQLTNPADAASLAVAANALTS